MNIYVYFTIDEIVESGKKIILSLTGIRICNSNAEMLLVDTTKVSKLTPFALTELALEEISKAWWIMFKKALFTDKRLNL